MVLHVMKYAGVDDPVSYTTEVEFAGQVIGEPKRLARCAIALKLDDVVVMRNDTEAAV